MQRRLITGRRPCPVRLTRVFELPDGQQAMDAPGLRVTDTIELGDPKIRVRRMSFGSDHQTVYTAAANVYQEGVLQPWVNLSEHVDKLNAERRVTLVREF